MRKTSYALTFLAVVVTLLLNVISSRRPDWLVLTHPEILRTRITTRYGLYELCELTVSNIPGGNGKITYRNYECRRFPTRVTDHCEEENSAFCAAWTSAYYVDQLAIGFAAVSLLTVLFGVSTHSRRRRIWKAVAGLIFLHAICQMVTFSIVTDMYTTSRYPAFEQARPGVAYALNTVSWVVGILVAFTVFITGVAANKGHRWAAGNRAYEPING